MPFSWETAQARQQSCLIAVLVPPAGVSSLDWGLSWGNMDKPPIWDVMRLSGLPFGEARTQAAIQCLNGGYQWLFFLDCDILAPKDTIPRLMSHRLPIVSGLYHQRFPTWTGISGEYLPCMFNEVPNAQGQLQKQTIIDFKPGSLVEAAYVPAGCLLIHRSVFERFLAAGIKRIFEWTLTAASEPPGTGRCVPAGEEVFGGSPIETITKGEEIFDQLGERSTVTNTFSHHYQGDLVKITPSCLKVPFRVTPEHNVLTLTRPTCRKQSEVMCRTRKNCCSNPIWKDNKPQFIPASELKKGMYLAFPKIAGHSVRRHVHLEEELRELLKYKDNNDRLHFRGCHSTLPSKVPVTPELLELLGLYVAEGYASVKSNMVSLSFGPHELSLAERTSQLFQETFNIKPWIAKGDHAWLVNVKRKPLATLFLKWFGVGARNKQIPEWVMRLPSRYVGYFLKGLWKGDGSEGYTSVNLRHSYWLNTSSKTLALQVAALLIKCNIHAGLFEYHAEKAFNHGAPMYRVTIYGGSAKFGRLIGHNAKDRHDRKKDISWSFFFDKKYWFPISEVKREAYDGPVHDLTVIPNNSFILGPAIVHNSEDFQFCFVARQIGFKCFVDTSIVCVHETGAKVTSKGLEPKI